MHPFCAGDIVECIDDDPLPERAAQPSRGRIRRGRIYQVESASCDDEHGCSICLQGVEDCAPGFGWHARRFCKLEAADADLRALLRSLAKERSALDGEIISVLEATAQFEESICTYVPGMSSHYRGKVYEASFGPIPQGVLTLHPKRRSQLYALAAKRNAALPDQSPLRSLEVERTTGGSERLVPSPPREPWTQPQKARQSRRS
jgi:hypothetical protein